MNFIFPIILGIIIPTDEHIFQRPTTITMKYYDTMIGQALRVLQLDIRQVFFYPERFSCIFSHLGHRPTLRKFLIRKSGLCGWRLDEVGAVAAKDGVRSQQSLNCLRTFQVRLMLPQFVCQVGL